MGFSVLDNVILDSGIGIQGLYFCIADNAIYTCRVVDPDDLQSGKYKYRYHCNFHAYANKDAKTSGKKYVDEICVIVFVDTPSVDPYQTMYTNFKSRFSNVVDE